MIYVKQNDTMPMASTTLLRGTVVVDLTLATEVRFKMVLRGANAGNLKVDGVASVVGSPTDGVCTYQWVTGDTDQPGTYGAEWEVTWDDGRVETFPTIGVDFVSIRPDLDGSS